MDPVTIQWCRGKGVFVAALVIAGQGMFGLGGVLVLPVLIHVSLEYGHGLWQMLSQLLEGETGKFREEPTL